MTDKQISHFFFSLKPIRQAHLWIALVLTLLSFSSHTTAQITNYTDSTQEALGQAFVNHLHQRYDVIQDYEINEYIRSIGSKIVQHTNSQKNFRFYVINNPSINAFAGPDGVIGIHTGLIASVSTEDELASVIAHEIAHVTQEHLYRRMVLQSESTLPQIASMIAAILIGMQDPNAGMATLLSSSAYQIEQQLKYSRLHEYEADFAGINFLSLSGYNPHAMPDFFQKLANSYQHQGMSAPEILRTHPLTENRLAKAQARAASLDKKTRHYNNETLGLIQQRLNNLYSLTSGKLTSKLNSDEKCYSKALDELSQKTALTTSIHCIENLISENVDQPLFHSIYLQLLAQLKNNKINYKINKDPKFSYELFPLNESVVLRYAELLILNEKSAQAISVLENFSASTLYKNPSETLTSKLYTNLDKTSYSYYHLALAQKNIGNLQRAAIFTQKAQAALEESDQALNVKIQNLQEKLAKTLKKLNDE